MLITIVIFGDGVKNYFFETYSKFDIILKNDINDVCFLEWFVQIVTVEITT